MILRDLSSEQLSTVCIYLALSEGERYAYNLGCKYKEGFEVDLRNRFSRFVNVVTEDKTLFSSPVTDFFNKYLVPWGVNANSAILDSGLETAPLSNHTEEQRMLVLTDPEILKKYILTNLPSMKSPSMKNEKRLGQFGKISEIDVAEQQKGRRRILANVNFRRNGWLADSLMAESYKRVTLDPSPLTFKRRHRLRIPIDGQFTDVFLQHNGDRNLLAMIDTEPSGESYRLSFEGGQSLDVSFADDGMLDLEYREPMLWRFRRLLNFRRADSQRADYSLGKPTAARLLPAFAVACAILFLIVGIKFVSIDRSYNSAEIIARVTAPDESNGSEKSIPENLIDQGVENPIPVTSDNITNTNTKDKIRNTQRTKEKTLFLKPRMVEVPINNRNWVRLITLAPGIDSYLLIDKESDLGTPISDLPINGRRWSGNLLTPKFTQNNHAFGESLRVKISNVSKDDLPNASCSLSVTTDGHTVERRSAPVGGYCRFQINLIFDSATVTVSLPKFETKNIKIELNGNRDIDISLIPLKETQNE